jgi:hypothetical protein
MDACKQVAIDAKYSGDAVQEDASHEVKGTATDAARAAPSRALPHRLRT